MTVDESKKLKKGTRVYWRDGAADSGIVTETRSHGKVDGPTPNPRALVIGHHLQQRRSGMHMIKIKFGTRLWRITCDLINKSQLSRRCGRPRNIVACRRDQSILSTSAASCARYVTQLIAHQSGNKPDPGRQSRRAHPAENKFLIRKAPVFAPR